MAVLDTHWHGNPKVLALGLAAMGLHAWSISYCDDLLTDGFVPEVALPQLPGIKQAVRRLLMGERWEKVDGGFHVHDYLEHNRSRQQVLELRAKDRDRKADAHNGTYSRRGVQSRKDARPQIRARIRPEDT